MRTKDHTPIAELVTFRLKDDASTEAFVTAATGIQPFLDSTKAVLSRTLSRDDDGLWTDHITWTSLELAKSTAESMMQRPEAGPMMSLIDPDSVSLRYAEIQGSFA